MRAVKEAKNFDASLPLFYFVNDQVVAMYQPPNLGSSLKSLSALRKSASFLASSTSEVGLSQ